jgi:SAM-dependent methyltransferase
MRDIVTIQAKAETAAAGRFLGVPTENFESAGREQLIYLLRAGLTPAAKVIDVGCGVLRGGYWLVHFLDPGCYCGIEPNKERLQIGIDHVLEPDILKLKQPRFDTNPHFDTSVFGEKFDFFVAYSVWTHASKPRIATMLDSFLRDSKETGIFLATYLPPNLRHGDYKGEHWVGTSHESDVPGCIHHRYRWIKAECKNRRLQVRKLSQDQSHGQFWLEIRRDSAPAHDSGFGKVGRLWRYLAARSPL